MTLIWFPLLFRSIFWSFSADIPWPISSRGPQYFSLILWAFLCPCESSWSLILPSLRFKFRPMSVPNLIYEIFSLEGLQRSSDRGKLSLPQDSSGSSYPTHLSILSLVPSLIFLLTHPSSLSALPSCLEINSLLTLSYPLTSSPHSPPHMAFFHPSMAFS